MLRERLIQMVQSRWEEIATAAIRRIRSDEEVPNMRKLPENDLRQWTRRILEALQSWELHGENESLATEIDELGRRRFESGVPLYEAVRSLQILKRNVTGFVREHSFAQNTLELYAQEELEHSIGLFFDWLLYHIAYGYERARNRFALLEK